MPARHISSQSFDEILSDLGDDPAIPDPHGIRKPPPQKNIPPRPSNQVNGNAFTESLSHFQVKNLAQGLMGPVILIVVLVAIAVGFFVIYFALNSSSQNALEESQKQISELRKEISLMRDEIYQDQDNLYIAIDEIEVSIHSLTEKKPDIKVFSKPLMSAHESELRRWRYLGASQMGITQQAYFHTGKSHLVFEKGSQVLGEWRLSNIEKGLATLNHSQGKSLVLKVSKGP